MVKQDMEQKDEPSFLENWFIVIFAFVFFGSIFNAAIIYLFSPESEVFFSILSYLTGLIFGLLAKYKKWNWII